MFLVPLVSGGNILLVVKFIACMIPSRARYPYKAKDIARGINKLYKVIIIYHSHFKSGPGPRPPAPGGAPLCDSFVFHVFHQRTIYTVHT